MPSLTTRSDRKNKPLGAKFGLTALAKWLVVLVVLAGVVFGGLRVVDSMNETAKKKAATNTVTHLLQEGTYASIRPYVSQDFLGDIAEADFNQNAQQLGNLKDSTVTILDVSEAGVFGTITPTDANKTGDYLFSFSASLKKTGFNTYKVSSLETDYGRQSFLSGDED